MAVLYTQEAAILKYVYQQTIGKKITKKKYKLLPDDELDPR